jgi:PleD family two-component response regulator
MRAESELVLLARTDGLTGLNNRRTFGEILEQEWRR